MIKLFVLGGCGLILVQILVVLVCWRFGAMRGRAVADWQDCDVKDREDWEYEDAEVLARIVQDACDAEPDPTAEHFQLWHADLTGRRRVRRYLRRMDRRSS